MHVLHTGAVKSGNSWLYTIVRLALDKAGVPDCGFWREHPCYRPIVETLEHRGSFEAMEAIDLFDVTPWTFRFELGRTDAFMPILDLDDYVSRCRQLWTHAAASDRLDEIVRRVDKVVCIVRDPRDVAVSFAHYVFAPTYVKQRPEFRFNTTTPQEYLDLRYSIILHDWCRHVYGYLRRVDRWPLHIVLYERLLSHFDEEFDRLLAHLGLRLDASAKREIKEQVSFGAMRRSGPDHARVGAREQWRRGLTAAQQQEALDVAGPLLRLLGYPTSATHVGTSEPAVPAALDWRGWVHDPSPHPDLRALSYQDLVRLYREMFQRVASESITQVAAWGADVSGRALLDAAADAGIAVTYVVDRDPSRQGGMLGGVRIVAPDEVGRHLPVLPFAIGSLGSIEAIRAEIAARFAFMPDLKVYSAVPGRGIAVAARSMRSVA